MEPVGSGGNGGFRPRFDEKSQRHDLEVADSSRGGRKDYNGGREAPRHAGSAELYPWIMIVVYKTRTSGYAAGYVARFR